MIEAFRDQPVLVLCPHTDDELTCAGTLIRLCAAGARVHYVALSRCEESVPAGLPLDVLEKECRRSTGTIGIDPERVEVWDFKVRHFPAVRQEILERFVALRRKLEPTLVFLPSTADRHQDHATVSEEGFRAFKHATVLGYEMPQNNIDFRPTVFVKLTEEELAQKLRALSAYESQRFRGYGTVEFTRSLATIRGVQANLGLAEAFEGVRMIL